MREKGEDYGLGEFEYEFSQLGYSLVLSGHLEEAIEIYKWNTTAFPTSSKAFEDLREVFLIKGDKEQTMQYYRKSLSLDPQNQRARKMLDKLHE